MSSKLEIPNDLMISTQSMVSDEYLNFDQSEIDELFSQVPSTDEFDWLNSSTSETSSARFGDPVTSSQVLAVQSGAVPKNTRKNTNWAVNVWSDWTENRKRLCPYQWPPHLMIILPVELNDWL